MTVALMVLAALLLVNAIFAASELSVMTSRPSRLQAMASRGSNGARRALQLAREPTRFLSTVQVGITLIAIFSGAYAERAFTEHVQTWLADYPQLQAYSRPLSLAIVVLLLTYVSLVFGELVPKRIAIAYPESVASFIASPVLLLSRLGAAPVRVLSWSTDAMLALLRVRSRGDDVSEEDVRALVARAASTGVFDPLEHALFERAMRMGDLTARSLMVPRGQITWIDESMPAEDVRVVIGTAPFSHFPVCAGSIDRLVGVVHVKDLIAYGLLAGADFKVASVMQAPIYVPETMPALKLLELLQRSRTRIAFVVDEHGGLEGLVTANDLVQAIVGDLSRGTEEEHPRATRRDDGSWLIDGRLPLPELLATLGLPDDAADELPDIATAAGLVTALIGDLPTTGERTQWKGWRFEVVDLDGRRVDKLLVSPVPAPSSH
ncbi:MAG: hemolysin family protein [Phycisphaerales bacterium]